MQGTLSPGLLPQLLSELYRGRRSGLFDLLRGREHLIVRLREGRVGGVETQEPPPEATARSDTVSLKLGQLLEQLGIRKTAAAPASPPGDSRERLLRALSWQEASYSFEEQEVAGGEDPNIGISTEQLILEGIRRIEDPDVVAAALGDMDRIPVLAGDYASRREGRVLTPTEGYIVSQVDGTLSARQIVDLALLEPDEMRRSLLGLLWTGLVTYLPVPPEAGRERPAEYEIPPEAVQEKPAEYEVPAVTVREATIEVDLSGLFGAELRAAASALDAEAKGAQTPSSGTAETTLSDEQRQTLETRRREILEAYEGLGKRSHFELLEVPETATEAQVKEAYFRMAKRFHPDAHHHPALADIRDEIEAVFMRIGAAYEALSHHQSRASYEAELARGRAIGTPMAGRGAGEVAPSLSQTKDMWAAEAAIHRAEYLLVNKKYWDVIQLLEAAIPLIENRKQKQRARVLLARAYIKNPNWVKRGEELLQTVTHEDPHNVDAYFVLGTIYKESGLRSRAVTMFRKVLELKPDHKLAAAELTPSRPLIKKLLGR